MTEKETEKNIKLLKLLSGESIIAELDVVQGQNVVIKNPFKVVSMKSVDSEHVTYGLTEFLELGDNSTIILSIDKIMLMGEPSNDGFILYNKCLEAINQKSQKEEIMNNIKNKIDDKLKKDEKKSKPSSDDYEMIYQDDDHPAIKEGEKYPFYLENYHEELN